MLGADAVIGTLADCGVRACFANPGTSEMHLVTALDREPRIRSVLCLFEGVATGAADGFARMSGVPATTLLHLGPGYLNGGANIHNLKRAYVPAVHLVGEHASQHRHLDAPLTSDIEALIKPLSIWSKTVTNTADLGHAAAEAFAASYGPPAGNAFLVLPADAVWSEGGLKAAPLPPPPPAQADQGVVEGAAQAIKRAQRPVLLLGGRALHDAQALDAAARISAAGVQVYADTFPARSDRGAGLFAPTRLPYFAESVEAALDGVDLMIVAGTREPVAFFAYPGRGSVLKPKDCALISLGGHDIDSAHAVVALADAMGARANSDATKPETRQLTDDCLDPFAVGVLLARYLPEGAIVSDDGVTSAMPIFTCLTNAARHSWLYGTGGAIGGGMPAAIGAAVASPNAKVVCLCGDGAAMYTVQSLWTMARERLNILTIIFSNRSYRVLNIELARTNAGGGGEVARQLLSLDDPALDWTKIAEGMGVQAARCADIASCDQAIRRLMSEPGPSLIEVVL